MQVKGNTANYLFGFLAFLCIPPHLAISALIPSEKNFHPKEDESFLAEGTELRKVRR
jgi:hypothetical protein